MHENAISVTYLIKPDDPQSGWSSPNTVQLPGWCAGDPQMALALYLSGTRDAVADIKVVNWSRVDPDPIPISRGEMGDLVFWFGINGHRYEGTVVKTGEGRPYRTRGDIENTYHSDDCGCHTEPWEYDPIDAY